MNAGAGRYRNDPSNGLRKASMRGKDPISRPSGRAIATAIPKLAKIRMMLAHTSDAN